MKRYLKDLNDEELRKVLEKNEKLYSKIYEDIFEDNMFWQSEDLKNLNIEKYVRIYNHYDTFYLKMVDFIGFFENIDTDYLCVKALEIYNKSKIYYNRYINTKNEITRDKNYDILQEKMEEMLEIVEEQLHEYENITDDDIFEYLKNDINGCFEDLYIDDDFVCYEHIDYEKCYK